MTEKVFCIDCKHRVSRLFLVPACKLSVDDDDINLVTGRIDRPLRSCARTREPFGKCGPNGDLWIPKNPSKLFQYIKKVSNKE